MSELYTHMSGGEEAQSIIHIGAEVLCFCLDLCFYQDSPWTFLFSNGHYLLFMLDSDTTGTLTFFALITYMYRDTNSFISLVIFYFYRCFIVIFCSLTLPYDKLGARLSTTSCCYSWAKHSLITSSSLHKIPKYTNLNL